MRTLIFLVAFGLVAVSFQLASADESPSQEVAEAAEETKLEDKAAEAAAEHADKAAEQTETAVEKAEGAVAVAEEAVEAAEEALGSTEEEEEDSAVVSMEGTHSGSVEKESEDYKIDSESDDVPYSVEATVSFESTLPEADYFAETAHSPEAILSAEQVALSTEEAILSEEEATLSEEEAVLSGEAAFSSEAEAEAEISFEEAEEEHNDARRSYNYRAQGYGYKDRSSKGYGYKPSKGKGKGHGYKPYYGKGKGYGYKPSKSKGKGHGYKPSKGHGKGYGYKPSNGKGYSYKGKGKGKGSSKGKGASKVRGASKGKKASKKHASKGGKKKAAGKHYAEASVEDEEDSHAGASHSAKLMKQLEVWKCHPGFNGHLLPEVEAAFAHCDSLNISSHNCYKACLFSQLGVVKDNAFNAEEHKKFVEHFFDPGHEESAGKWEEGISKCYEDFFSGGGTWPTSYSGSCKTIKPVCKCVHEATKCPAPPA